MKLISRKEMQSQREDSGLEPIELGKIIPLCFAIGWVIESGSFWLRDSLLQKLFYAFEV